MAAHPYPPPGYCGNTWTPRTCRSLATNPATRIRSPIDHVCMSLRRWPHVCVCVRCEQRALLTITKQRNDTAIRVDARIRIPTTPPPRTRITYTSG